MNYFTNRRNNIVVLDPTTKYVYTPVKLGVTPVQDITIKDTIALIVFIPIIVYGGILLAYLCI